ncbi:hypothetical protein G5714_001588 [Onychostoma macrolepis]|uniref:Uncharacterized protein n=1 Tax=Onychostoma macrolepis TaxID=369639 RepID=A0A7J6DDC3_9TELE|nr:hypothetical protein G5714_001588 [Onychostoma macrolepis]
MPGTSWEWLASRLQRRPADPFKSMMPYWAPEESLEDYINLALHLSGSAFRVELAAEPAPEAAINGASKALSAAPMS